jgi:hypothetical protein
LLLLGDAVAASQEHEELVLVIVDGNDALCVGGPKRRFTWSMKHSQVGKPWLRSRRKYHCCASPSK